MKSVLPVLVLAAVTVLTAKRWFRRYFGRRGYTVVIETGTASDTRTVQWSV